MKCKASMFRAVYLFALAVLCLAANGAQASIAINDTVYWTEVQLDNVQRAPLAGGSPEILFSAPPATNPAFTEIDTDPAGSLYWVDQNSSSIYKSALDGSNPQVIHNSTIATDIELDLTSDKVYWSSAAGSGQGIYRADLDGQNVEQVLSAAVRGLALDVGSGVIYWTLQSNQVLRSDLDGSNTILVSNATPAPNDIEFDTATNQLFWTDNVDRAIYRSDTDGNNLIQIVDRSAASTNPQRMELDGSGLIYWSDNTAGTIEYANLDGTGQTVLRSGLDHPIGVAIGPVPEPASLTLLALGGLAVLRRRRRQG